MKAETDFDATPLATEPIDEALLARSAFCTEVVIFLPVFPALSLTFEITESPRSLLVPSGCSRSPFSSDLFSKSSSIKFSCNFRDLKILPKEEDKRNSFFEKLKNNQFKLLYLLGSDNLDIKKNNEFIVYQGSHGDRGAEIADLILPSAAFTEQNGLYENLEGRVQECKKASYPIGEALEDWKILNLILKALGKNENLLNFDSLREDVLKSIPNFSKLNELPKFKDCELINSSPYFESEEVYIKELDYYFTNAISRASKTMSECRQIKHSSKKTGTDNL